MENETAIEQIESEGAQSGGSIGQLTESIEVFQEDAEKFVEPAIIYGLVDLSKGIKGIEFAKVGAILPVTLWHQLYKLKGKETQRFETLTLTLEQLQYLYWNTVKKAPPADDRDGLERLCESLIQDLPIDATLIEDIRAEIDELKPKSVVEIQEAEGDSMTTKKGPLLKPGEAKAARAAKPKAEKAVKEPKEPKAPKPAKVAKEKKPKAEVAGLKVGDVFVGKFKGIEYEVSAVETSEGIQFKLKGGGTFATKSAASKALWEKKELPAEGLKTFRFRGPVEKSAE